ncbi:MAG: hypothetical protein P1V36_01875 [Planctomycetota bacterium]|nr:hypothetical protein [Planctomycetota bacterium]
MAVIGTTVFYLDGNAYYSPEFGRGGLAATFSVDLTQLVLGGATSFLIGIESRNADDTTWTASGAFGSFSSVGADQVDLTGLKEIVRFKYSFAGGTPAASDAAHFLMMAPSWRPY